MAVQSKTKKTGKAGAPVQFGVPSEAPVAAVVADATPNVLAMDVDVEALMAQPVVHADPAPAEAPDAIENDTLIENDPLIENATPTEGRHMNETIDTAAANTADTIHAATAAGATAMHDATEKGAAMFGDMSGRTKQAMEKGTKAIEEIVEFSKGNLEAMTTSGRVAAKGAEEIAKYSAEYGRATIERANAAARQFAAVKSPAEFFQLQGEIAKQTLDAMVAEGSKFTENYMKLMGEVAQPLSNRYAMAAEKVKSTIA